jgi:hypothetical protein
LPRLAEEEASQAALFGCRVVALAFSFPSLPLGFRFASSVLPWKLHLLVPLAFAGECFVATSIWQARLFVRRRRPAPHSLLQW